MSANNDYTERLRRLQAKTLAHYHSANPTMKEQGAISRCFDSSSYTIRKLGEMSFTLKPGGGLPINDPCCDDTASSCIPIGEITNFSTNNDGDNGSFVPPYDIYDWKFTLTWDTVTNATDYSVTADTILPYLVVKNGLSTADIYFNYGGSPSYPNIENTNITITFTNACSSSSATAESRPCFLAGSLVTLYNGIQKAIEDIVIGDLVLGAFGEINTVLALHRPLLGNKKMLNINNEHHTTSHHPHVGANKGFFCLNPELLDTQIYGREVDVLGENNIPKKLFLHGLKPGRSQMLEVGTELKTVEGSRFVSSLETYELPPETQLYNLVVSGSHTYHVDCYAVTGFPREDDFDYDSWKARM